MTREDWEFRFKACAAITAVATAVSIFIGGCVGLYTYRKQVEAAESLKHKEMRLIEYSQKRDVYYELVDAAATVASSLSKADGEKHAAHFYALYFGKAHVAVIDSTVYDAKKQFSHALQRALAAGAWPTDDLDMPALELSKACQKVLRAQNVIEDPARLTPEQAASDASR